METKVLIIPIILILASVSIFYVFSVDTAIYFAIIVVPVIFVAIATLYYKRGKSSVNEADYFKENELKDFANNIKNIMNKMNTLKEKYNIDTHNAEREINSIKEQLAEVGCQIRNDEIKYNRKKLGKTKLNQITELKNNTDITNSVVPPTLKSAQNKVDWYTEKLSELSKKGFDVNDAINHLQSIKTKNASNLDQVEEIVSESEKTFSKALETHINSTQQVIEQTNQTNLLKKVNNAREELENKEYESTINSLSQIATNLNENLYENFTSYKQRLIKHLDEITKILREEHKESYIELKQSIESLESPTKIQQLNSYSENLYNLIKTTMDEIYTEIQNDDKRINSLNLPDWVANYSQPDKVQLPQELDEAVPVFIKEYQKLDEILSETRKALKIGDSYSKIEALISEKLNEKGILRKDELKIKYPEAFMELYNHYNPDTTYEDGELKAENFVEGIEEPEKTEKPEESSEEDGREVEQDLRSKLCGGKESKVKSNLPKFEDQFESIIKEKGYVSSKDSIPVKNKDLIPCFLYLWTEERDDLHFAEYDNEFIVYDVNAKSYSGPTESTGVDKKNEILNDIKEIEELIAKQLPGANLDEAEELKSNALKELNSGNLEKAEELAKKAKLSTQPTPDYILQNAKDLAAEAEKCFNSEDYSKCIEQWKKSLEEYKRAKRVALERGDEELSNSINNAVDVIEDNIENAEVALDNSNMLSLISQGSKKVEKANELYNKERYDDAKKRYEDAFNDYNNAFKLAEKREFTDDIEKIKDALESIKDSIEASIISKGDKLIRDNEIKIDDSPAKAEKNFKAFLEDIKDVQLTNKDAIDGMKKRASEGLIASKIKQAENIMKEAEDLYSKGKYYESKEKYRKTWDYLKNVAEKANNMEALSKIEYINELIDACTKNIKSATDALASPESVDLKIEKVSQIGHGKGKVKQEATGTGHPIEELTGEYQQIRYIGSGGFADVYKAEKDGETVAIKIPRELTKESEEVFFNELEKWKQLKHRNIVNLIEPRLSPHPHMVVEYVGGKNLDQLIREGIRVDEACKVAFDVARGLEYAHDNLITHCDLKPKNILLNKIGEAKITDFGLAKKTTGSSGFKGLTPLYAAPEQIEDQRADDKTDVYQLGLMMYEMIAKRNPFDDTTGSIEKKILNETPDPPSSFNPEAQPLDDVIMRCLSKDPNERPSVRSIREVIYEYSKKHHGESLHLTKNYKSYVKVTVRNAFYAAKYGDPGECISCLTIASDKISDKEIRDEVNSLIKGVEKRQEEGIGFGDEFLKYFETIMRKIEDM